MFLRGLFPRFYRLGLVCGGLMLAGLALLSIRYGSDGWLSTLVAVTLVMVLLEAGSLTLVPRINAARDAGAEGARRFDRLHRLSVSLTIVVLILGATLLVRLSNVPALTGGA